MRIPQRREIWFLAAAIVSLTASGTAVATHLEQETGASISIAVSAPETVPVGTHLTAYLRVTNHTDEPAHLTVRYSLQRDASLYSRPLPDPVFGADHAAGCQSWLVVDGEIVAEPGSTDGKPWTSAETAWQREHFTEAFQLVDLGQMREIRKMTWLSGDANHSWFVDVFASEDGATFAAVPGLSNVDHYQKWGWHDFPLEQPFKARLIKFRYRTDGKSQDIIRFPSELGVYDGVTDEVIALPEVGPVFGDGKLSMEVPPHSSAVQGLTFDKPLNAGAYLLGISVKGHGPDVLSYSHVFSELEEQPDLIGPHSRLGLNAANAKLAPKLRELGIGSVRFENGKWPFVSAEPHKYSFTGEVAPWHLSLDEIYQTYHDAGLDTLTYMFMTPSWASSAPAGAADSMRLSFPPQDLSWYGEFCFQLAARYGSRKHPDDELLTTDKRSGLDLVKYYELWNEPNLNPSPEATWGGWAAPMDRYYEMMRFGAEAVKRADPDAVVTSAGYAGMSVETVDSLRTYQYPDGKCPLDFVDIINVHFYSGQEPPETCTTDGNAHVTSSTPFSENLRELAAWRDRYAAQKPIWMTETGYDSAGPFGTTEAIQAARLPRVVMLCLANGVERVLVYRETGSTPSMHACSGVLREDFSPKPSWFTFGTLIRQFHGVQGGAKRLPHADENVWLMEWDAGGTPLLTVWTVDGVARLGVDLGACTITDSFGGVTRREFTQDVEVTAYPLYIRDLATLAPLQQLHAEFERQEAAKAARLERVRALHQYLFDFGSAEHVGHNNIEGHRSEYVPVLSSTVWDEARGYGFDKPAFGDDDWPWLKGQDLDRDATRVREQVFQFRVAPGEYDLVMKVLPFEEHGQLIVSGVDGGPLTLPVEKKKKPVTTTRVKASGERPMIGIRVDNDYGHFTWVSCVETIQ